MEYPPYTIENVAKSITKLVIIFKPNVADFEPYYQLSPSSVCELMDSSKADELVSQTLLHEVQTILCQLHHLEPQTHFCSPEMC